MTDLEHCLSRIHAVRLVAGDPELAYPARTRLYRVVLSCLRLVARRLHLPQPRTPLAITLPLDAPPALQSIVEVVNEILERSRYLCQPSEPLDDRWEAGWSALLQLLDKLEERLPNAVATSHV